MKKLLPVSLLLILLLSGCSPYSTDISDLDCNLKLSFVVEYDDADGDRQHYLRTIDFASDAIADVHLKGVAEGELVYGDSLQDIRLLSYGDGERLRIHKLGADGSLSDELFVPMDYYDINEGAKFNSGYSYDAFGLLNGELRTWDDYGIRFVEKYNYAILSYYPDGRVLGFYPRDTGKTISYTYKDENGKNTTGERPMKGYTLYIEDVQSNTIPVMDYGEDMPIHEITHAGWFNGDNLLIIGRNEKNKSHFYRVNIPSGSAEILKTSGGKPVEAYVNSLSDNSHMTLSADGRYVSYRPTSGMIMAADLHTGKSCSVYNAAFDRGYISSGDIQFWH